MQGSWGKKGRNRGRAKKEEVGEQQDLCQKPPRVGVHQVMGWKGNPSQLWWVLGGISHSRQEEGGKWGAGL